MKSHSKQHFQNTSQISLSAGVDAKGELEAGISLLRVQGGVKGTFLKGSLTGYINYPADGYYLIQHEESKYYMDWGHSQF